MNTRIEPGTRYTPDDLLRMPDRKSDELVDGILVERNGSPLSGLVAATLTGLVGNHCDANDLSWVFDSTCGYRCFPDDPDKVPRADLSWGILSGPVSTCHSQ